MGWGRDRERRNQRSRKGKRGQFPFLDQSREMNTGACFMGSGRRIFPSPSVPSGPADEAHVGVPVWIEGDVLRGVQEM